MSGREEVRSNDKSPAKRHRKAWTAVATGSLSALQFVDNLLNSKQICKGGFKSGKQESSHWL